MVTEEDFISAQEELVGSVRYVNVANKLIIVQLSWSIISGCGLHSKRRAMEKRMRDTKGKDLRRGRR